MSDHCDGCGEWDLPEGLTGCSVCYGQFCIDCVDDDEHCGECSVEDADE